MWLGGRRTFLGPGVVHAPQDARVRGAAHQLAVRMTRARAKEKQLRKDMQSVQLEVCAMQLRRFVFARLHLSKAEGERENSLGVEGQDELLGEHWQRHEC